MANVSSSNGLEKRPKLRFPGFDEPWRAEKLSDFAERVTRLSALNIIEARSICSRGLLHR